MSIFPSLTRRVSALLAVVAVAACAPPPPGPAAWYQASDDTIHVVDFWMHQTFVWYGQPGVDWLMAHEEGHREVLYRLRAGVDVAGMMPGGTDAVREEQAAQCEAAAAGHVQPWRWGPAEVAEGYWVCPPEYVAVVAAA